MTPSISILMATYNGQAYLGEQLDSIFVNSYPHVHLHIRDDASTDGTWDILTHYRSLHPERITLYRNEHNSGNARHTFFQLMTTVRDDYLMLCDQDDVWLPHKIATSLSAVQTLENQHTANTPVLVRSNVTIVDSDLQTIADSYATYMNANFHRTHLAQVLIQNTAPGCGMIYNRALAERLAQAPTYCIMHDWWLELMAAAFGMLGHIQEPTLLYRQHSANEIGVKPVTSLSYKLSRLANLSGVKHAINITYDQAQNFLNLYGDQLAPEQLAMVRAYCNIPSQTKYNKLRTIGRLGAYKNGLSRNIMYLLVV